MEFLIPSSKQYVSSARCAWDLESLNLSKPRSFYDQVKLKPRLESLLDLGVVKDRKFRKYYYIFTLKISGIIFSVEMGLIYKINTRRK